MRGANHGILLFNTTVRIECLREENSALTSRLNKRRRMAPGARHAIVGLLLGRTLTKICIPDIFCESLYR